MPELPEAERAHQTLELAIGRRIAAAEDGDTYVCRPHQPGEIDAALRGERLAAVHRRGKCGIASRFASTTAVASPCATSAVSAVPC